MFQTICGILGLGLTISIISEYEFFTSIEEYMFVSCVVFFAILILLGLLLLASMGFEEQGTRKSSEISN